jgi:hypothetical protein
VPVFIDCEGRETQCKDQLTLGTYTLRKRKCLQTWVFVRVAFGKAIERCDIANSLRREDIDTLLRSAIFCFRGNEEVCDTMGRSLCLFKLILEVWDYLM